MLMLVCFLKCLYSGLYLGLIFGLYLGKCLCKYVKLFVKVVEKDKFDAARFSPFWNEIIASLREEDYITNLWVLSRDSCCYMIFMFFYLVLSGVYGLFLLPQFHILFNLLWFSREMELLQMPKNNGNLPMVQWPLFLLVSKVSYHLKKGDL